ncbi:MAG TPA: ABC transporter permease [Bryobacteraceae bacterium]|nr:ABC transporter permease [Bryobacteraceae bacterium]
MVFQDIRHAIRLMIRQPAFTLSVIAVLAVGVGANAAVFSLVNHVLFQPLPYPESAQLHYVWRSSPERRMPQASFSAPEYQDFASRIKSFSRLAAFRNYAASWTGDGPPLRVMTRLVTTNYLRMLGKQPLLGRDFSQEEGVFGRGNVVILSEKFWRTRMGAARDVVGRLMFLDKEQHEIVGVVAELPGEPRAPDMYIPAAFSPQELATREARYLSVMGRLAPGTSPQRAQAELDSICRALGQEHPATDGGWTTFLTPAHQELTGPFGQPLLVLFAAVGLLFLIACFNLVNLMLVRFGARRKEIALRSALGANPWRVFRQLLAESLVLSLAGGAVGAVLGWQAFGFVRDWSLLSLPRLENAKFDWQAMLFAILLALSAGLVFGCLPSWRAVRLNLADSLREEARGGTAGTTRSVSRSVLVISEVALSAILLVAAGLLVRTITGLTAIDPGFSSSGVITCRATLPDVKYPTPEMRATYVRDVLAKLEALPGARAAGVTTSLPFMQVNWIAQFAIEGRPDLDGEKLSATYNAVSPGYFDALRIPIVKGRKFLPNDDLTAPPVVLISRAMERTWFAGRDAVGQHLRMKVAKHEFRVEVVGVVDDVKHLQLDEPPRDAIYQPHAQLPWPFLAFAIRTDSAPESMMNSVRQAFYAADPETPIDRLQPLGRLLDIYLAQKKLAMALLSIFAVLALALSSVGLYGVLSVSVAQRTREFGIRAALGATRTDLIRLVFRDGLLLALLGLAIGLACSPMATRTMESMLYGVDPLDGVTLAMVGVLLALVSAAAILTPALRASRVDPGEALRDS